MRLVHCLIAGSLGWLAMMSHAETIDQSSAEQPSKRPAQTFWVDGSAAHAADTNAGTAEQPWKTLRRAGGAPELQPGDTVLVRTGVYREHFEITVSGSKENPIRFAAAPGAKVVVKGSEIITGKWTLVQANPPAPEPYPNAYRQVWSIQLDERFFTDPDFSGSYADSQKWWLSQVFLDDFTPLQRIGPDPIYPNEPFTRLRYVGRGLEDLTDNSFWFDSKTRTLYVRIAGDPAWYLIETGVRGMVFSVKGAHDVTVSGFEFRHNRMPTAQWSMTSLSSCSRVTLADCAFALADFCGLAVSHSTNCVVQRCDASFNGNTGITLYHADDCIVEDSRMNFNNYRHFYPFWHAGGMKSIPANRRCIVRRCEAAYNVVSAGIWFDADNEDVQILDSVCHHNGGEGIMYEINPGGGLIAGNLCYANRLRGIYCSGSQRTWIVHNTVAGNHYGGIVGVPREGEYVARNVHILNNLLLANYTAGADLNRGNDLILFMGVDPSAKEAGPRTIMDNHSDYNVFASGPWTPYLRHNLEENNTLTQWQKRFGEDLHSTTMPIDFEMQSTGFRVKSADRLPKGGPLPKEVMDHWKPPTQRVGSPYTQWP